MMIEKGNTSVVYIVFVPAGTKRGHLRGWRAVTSRREATVLNIKQQDVLKVGITYTLTYLRDTYRHSSIDLDVAIFNTVSIHIAATTSVR
jgi:hypothetical protein